MFKNIKEFFYIVYFMFKLRDKTLTEDQLDILMFGDLKTADERLGRVRHADGTTSYMNFTKNDK
ncbi:MAG: hypothetical protein IPI17_05225 [Nitrosomonas sp.]|jgi:hypothetical protein|nr:hypothetical protein [Nitrosomonas sp.]